MNEWMKYQDNNNNNNNDNNNNDNNKTKICNAHDVSARLNWGAASH